MEWKEICMSETCEKWKSEGGKESTPFRAFYLYLSQKFSIQPISNEKNIKELLNHVLIFFCFGCRAKSELVCWKKFNEMRKTSSHNVISYRKQIINQHVRPFCNIFKSIFEYKWRDCANAHRLNAWNISGFVLSDILISTLDFN